MKQVAASGSVGTVSAIAKKYKAMDFRLGALGEDRMQTMRVLIDDDRLQSVLDTLQNVLGAQPTARIVVLPVEVSPPKPPEKEGKRKDPATAAREALLEEVEKSARLDRNYLVLVALSTLVAAIGLIENSVAVVIGAMVIAPLLGPNLALSLGTALGDTALMGKAAPGPSWWASWWPWAIPRCWAPSGLQTSRAMSSCLARMPVPNQWPSLWHRGQLRPSPSRQGCPAFW